MVVSRSGGARQTTETAAAAQGTAIVRFDNTVGSCVYPSQHPLVAEREPEVLVDLAPARVSAGSAGHMESSGRYRRPTEQPPYFCHCHWRVSVHWSRATLMARLTREI